MNIAKSWMPCFFKPKVHPVEVAPKICMICMESGATRRPCCNSLFCDHCYTKNKLCPYCNAATRQEKMTGATYVLNVYSEHEECRICLDPGLKRRCCGNYYCDDCYYSQPKCRSCNADVASTSKVPPMSRAAIISVVLGWLAAFFVILLVASGVMVVSYSESLTPKGMWNYKCYGFFSKCDVHFCMDFSSQVASGNVSLPPLSSWQYCNLDSVAKMETYGCIFDSHLYVSTGKRLGFDMCYTDFNPGLYVFEDTFEYWQNLSFHSNQMKSALWDDIVNGAATSYCGAGEVFGGKKALSFSGLYNRYAITKDVDVSSGGWLEAEMFMAPIGFDVSHPYCKSSYGSYINVEYSTNQGYNWTVLGQFNAWVYRQNTFFPVKFELPSDAISSNTRFRFIQRSFEAARDAWALDNVRVFRKLPADWHTSTGFLANLQTTLNTIQRAQCCFDTDWCETRLSAKEMDNCKHYFPFYHGRRYLLRGSEMFVCVAVFISVIKFLYVSVQEYIVRKRIPFADEYNELIQMKWFYQWLPPRFRPKRSLSDYSKDIHMSARLVEDLKNEFNDAEGQGESQVQKEERAKAKKKERERRLKEKKKLMARMKSKHYQATANDSKILEDAEEVEGDAEEEEGKEEGDDNHDNDAEKTKFGIDQMATEMDKFKRQNVALLRIPFDTKSSLEWRQSFAAVSLLFFVVLALFKMATTQYYIVHEQTDPYGTGTQSLSITSAGMIIFAMYADLKEIYHNIKYVVPVRQQWIPYLTVDLTEEINALFVGHHAISLSDITENYTFPASFIRWCAFLFFLGGFPWCLFSLIIRDQFLKFTVMRVVTPTFGVIMMLRAILGPGFILKIVFSFTTFFDPDMKTREQIGLALQSERSHYAALTSAFAFSIGGAFFCSAIFFSLTDIVLGAGFLVGFLYGLMTGCYHSMPIRPWMCITVLESGTWLRVKKKERCPCIYWGNFCNLIHQMDEMFVVFPTDEVRFRNVVKNGMNLAGK